MADYNDGIIPEPCLRLDYGFGQEYASVELGDGTGYVRVTDDLRGEYHKMQRWYDEVLKAALDENDKLRELAQDAWGTGHADRSCEACDIMDECHAEMERYGRCLFERRIEQRMSELGIEVKA